jgi:Flp pilus assembly pilin Flp
MAAAICALQAWYSAKRSDDRGASLVEYALLLALIFAVCVVAVGVLGDTASTSFSSTGAGFTAN